MCARQVAKNKQTKILHGNGHSIIKGEGFFFIIGKIENKAQGGGGGQLNFRD